MVIYGFVIPIVAVLSVLAAAVVYGKIKYRPLVFGRMLSKVGPVVYEQILEDINRLAEKQALSGGWLQRKARQQYARLNWFYLCQESAQTILFLRVLRFEALRIAETKSGLEYDDRETVVVQLKDEFIELRWKQIRCQVIFLLRANLELHLNQDVLIKLLEHYKRLEDEFVQFVGMINEEHQRMLTERLGLRSWGLIESE